MKRKRMEVVGLAKNGVLFIDFDRKNKNFSK